MEVWVAFAGTAGPVLVGAVAIGRKLERVLHRQVEQSGKIDAHDARARNTELRNCAHHGLIFERLDIHESEVMEREQMAGVKNPGQKP